MRCVLAALLAAGCRTFEIFEDVGTDPHPPTVEITALVHYVSRRPRNHGRTPTYTEDESPAAGAGRAVTWDSGGFTLAPASSSRSRDLHRRRRRHRQASTSATGTAMTDERSVPPTDQTLLLRHLGDRARLAHRPVGHRAAAAIELTGIARPSPAGTLGRGQPRQPQREGRIRHHARRSLGSPRAARPWCARRRAGTSPRAASRSPA